MNRIIRNDATGTERTWEIDGLKYMEIVRQQYTNCYIAAGFVEGHPTDTLYVELFGPDKPQVFVLLRPDEAAAIAWVLTGALWSLHIEDVPEDTGTK